MAVTSTSADEPRAISAPVSVPDKIYRFTATGAAVFSLILMALVAIFLAFEAWPALSKAGWSFFTEKQWRPDETVANAAGVETQAPYGVFAMVWGTVAIALIALSVAVPIALGAALFINEYAPIKLRPAFISIVDLLAAVPSLIFGLWGLNYLQPELVKISKWTTDWLGWIPIFRAPETKLADGSILKGTNLGSSFFVTGVVVGIMIIPIIASVSRAVMAETPRVFCEAALGLGGTKWSMIRHVIFPFSKGGIIGASMLGLGRALGETIAIALILSFDGRTPFEVLFAGGSSVAGTIANRFGDAAENGRSALIGAGLVLFFLTLAVNVIAQWVVTRSGREKKATASAIGVRAGK